jgi:catalase
MTYQEIIQAIESLPIEQQDSLIEAIRQQQNGKSHLTVGVREASRREASPVENRSCDSNPNDRSIYRAVERTPEQTAEGLEKIEKFFQKKRDLWNSMTEEERQTSISQFAMLDEYLKDSRG